MTDEERALHLSNLGFDVNRIWCNSFTVSKGPGIGLIVAREGINMTNDPADHSDSVSKNLISLVMPEDSAVQLRDLLIQIFPLATPGA